MKRLITICTVVVLLGAAQVEATWTSFDMPGAVYTQVWGIDGDNVVGYYSDGSKGYGFLYDGTTWTTLDWPGSTFTIANDIDGDNVVGYYEDSFGYHGFLYVIPEPATLLILGLGVFVLRRKTNCLA